MRVDPEDSLTPSTPTLSLPRGAGEGTLSRAFADAGTRGGPEWRTAPPGSPLPAQGEGQGEGPAEDSLTPSTPTLSLPRGAGEGTLSRAFADAGRAGAPADSVRTVRIGAVW